MKFLKRLFGICETPLPVNADAWTVDNGAVRIDLARMPELQAAGSGVRLEGSDIEQRLLVLHGDDDQYYAVANRCTHMGRRIDTIRGSHAIECCSVSKSTFTYGGRPVSGAAKKPLTTYPVSVEGETLVVALSRQVGMAAVNKGSRIPGFEDSSEKRQLSFSPSNP